MLARELAKRGHDIDVVALAGPGGSQTEMDGNIVVHRIEGWNRMLRRFYVDPHRPFHPTLPDPGVVQSLRALIKERQPEVAHVHSWMLHSFLPILPTPQTRLVVTMHEYGLICPKGTFVYHDGVCTGPKVSKCVTCASGQYGVIRSTALTTGLAAMRPLRNRVDRYIAVSSAVAKACTPLIGQAQRPIDVIPPFLYDESFLTEDAGRPAFVPALDDYVMFAGALGPHKGIDVLLDAWAGLEADVPLVIIGLRRHDTPREFPDGVIVVENIAHEDVLRAWRHCAFAVVPSRWPDPCPLVALEAMAVGKPVIASAVGGLPDLVEDHRSGLLVPPGDSDALRSGILRLWADPALRSEMGDAGRQRAASYSAKAVLPRIEKVYQEVISSSRFESSP
jgi:glycosyltransferase involved in cell wall biosynthesis